MAAGTNGRRCRLGNQSGFSLIEVLVATSLLVVGVAGLAQLFVLSINSNHGARNTTFASILAQQKMEQLRGLTWGFDTIGLPISDITTDLSVSPENPAGGTGLSPSPSDALRRNTAGYVDYLDVNGRPLGGGATAPPGTAYIRRWSIEPLPTNPNDTLVLQVLVTRRSERGAANEGKVNRLPQEARMVSVKSRKAL